MRSLSLRPGNSPATPYGGRVNGLQVIVFSPPCHPCYGALALTPAGLSPAERASLCWTHRSSITARTWKIPPTTPCTSSCGARRRTANGRRLRSVRHRRPHRPRITLVAPAAHALQAATIAGDICRDRSHGRGGVRSPWIAERLTAGGAVAGRSDRRRNRCATESGAKTGKSHWPRLRLAVQPAAPVVQNRIKAANTPLSDRGRADEPMAQQGVMSGGV